MKKNKFILFGIAAAMLALPFSAGFGSISAVEKDTTDYNEINIHNIKADTAPRVIFETENSVTYRTEFTGDEITNEAGPSSAPLMWAGYSIKNIQKNGSYTDETIVVSSDDIVAGSSAAYKASRFLPTSIEGVLSIGPAEFNAKAGLKNSASVSVSKRFSYTCPKKKGNKTVASCTVTYYPKYQKYKFEEYFLGIKSGTGNAEVFVGFTQDETISYEK